MFSRALKSCYFRLFYVMLMMKGLATASLVPLPTLNIKNTLTTEDGVISMNERQTMKIGVQGNGLGYVKLNITEKNQPIDYCSVSDRHVSFQQLNPLDIPPPTSYDVNGFATSQPSSTVAWIPLNPVPQLFNGTIAHLDSTAKLRLIRLDPTTNTTIIVYTMQIDPKVVMDNTFMNSVYLAQVGNSLILAYQTSDNTMNVIKIYLKVAGSSTLAQIQISDIAPVFSDSTNTYGNLVDMSSYNLANGDFLLFLLQDQLFSIYYLSNDLTKISSLKATSITSGIFKKQFVDMRVWENSVTNTLNIYVLCAINGIYRFTYMNDSTISRTQNVLFDTSFFISIPNGEVFNVYKGRQFFVTISNDPYQVREYEIILNQNNNYYLNRIHDVDHKVKDIVVYDFFIVILGSNSHTVSWHSVHPSLVANMVLEQQYFSAFSLQGGIILPLLNSTSGLTEPYLVGLQRYHVFIMKILPVNPYVSCQPQNSSDDGIIGKHLINVGFISQDWPNANSFQVQNNQVQSFVQINKVYADSLTAGAIAGIVIAVVVVIVIVIVLIVVKIKRQREIKYTLQKEVDTLSTRKNSFQALRQQGSLQDNTPNARLRQASEVEFGGANSDKEIMKPPAMQLDKKEDTHENEDQIIKFQEDDDE